MINLELKFENEQNTYHMHISLPESEVQEWLVFLKWPSDLHKKGQSITMLLIHVALSGVAVLIEKSNTRQSIIQSCRKINTDISASNQLCLTKGKMKDRKQRSQGHENYTNVK